MDAKKKAAYNGELLPSGLFDYQEAAIEHCFKRLKDGDSALLTLGTGLGKTVVAREVLLRLGVGSGKRALVACPSGLGVQLGETLRRAPWEQTDSLVVGVADTGKKLTLLCARSDLPVLVINYALSWYPEQIGHWDYLVVDEAHKFGQSRLQKCMQSIKGPTLFMTATPSQSLARGLIDGDISQKQLFEKAYGVGVAEAERQMSMPSDPSNDQRRMFDKVKIAECSKYFIAAKKERDEYAIAATFHLEKTENIIKNIGGAVPSVDLRIIAQPKNYKMVLLKNLNETPETRRDRELHMAHSRALAMAIDALSLKLEDSGDSRYVRFLTNNEARMQLLEGVSQEELSRAVHILHKAHILTLQSLHDNNIVKQPWTAPLPKSSRCLLARFYSQRCLEKALSDSEPEKGVKIMKLTTDMPAAKRARIVSTLNKGKSALIAFGRASQSDSNSSLLGCVLRIGQNWFLREVVSYVSPRITVLAADQSVDVGYNLHRHVDAIWIPQVPVNREQMQQLLGRMCRADTPRIGKSNCVSVVMNAARGTLDEFFLKRCGVSLQDE